MEFTYIEQIDEMTEADWVRIASKVKNMGRVREALAPQNFMPRVFEDIETTITALREAHANGESYDQSEDAWELLGKLQRQTRAAWEELWKESRTRRSTNSKQRSEKKRS